MFSGVTVEPSLLHGDLWSGNVGEVDHQPGNTCNCIPPQNIIFCNHTVYSSPSPPQWCLTLPHSMAIMSLTLQSLQCLEAFLVTSTLPITVSSHRLLALLPEASSIYSSTASITGQTCTPVCSDHWSRFVINILHLPQEPFWIRLQISKHWDNEEISVLVMCCELCNVTRMRKIYI